MDNGPAEPDGFCYWCALVVLGAMALAIFGTVTYAQEMYAARHECRSE